MMQKLTFSKFRWTKSPRVLWILFSFKTGYKRGPHSAFNVWRWNAIKFKKWGGTKKKKETFHTHARTGIRNKKAAHARQTCQEVITLRQIFMRTIWSGVKCSLRTTSILLLENSSICYLMGIQRKLEEWASQSSPNHLRKVWIFVCRSGTWIFLNTRFHRNAFNRNVGNLTWFIMNGI